MADFYDYDSIAAAIDEKVERILKRDVAPVAKNILKKHIESDIYGAYAPKESGWFGGKFYEHAYARRGVLPNRLKSIMEDKTTILITSVAPANRSLVKGYKFSNDMDGAFLMLLESGHMGAWKTGFARPAVANAQKEIDKSSAIKSAINNGLKREIG